MISDFNMDTLGIYATRPAWRDPRTKTLEKTRLCYSNIVWMWPSHFTLKRWSLLDWQSLIRVIKTFNVISLHKASASKQFVHEMKDIVAQSETKACAKRTIMSIRAIQVKLHINLIIFITLLHHVCRRRWRCLHLLCRASSILHHIAQLNKW